MFGVGGGVMGDDCCYRRGLRMGYVVTRVSWGTWHIPDVDAIFVLVCIRMFP
jgi:hypothetical protein